MENSLIAIGNSLMDITNILKEPWNLRDWIFSITPFILTIISFVLAIYVPYKIMNKQNKIALFEKRYNIFHETESIVFFSNSITKINVFQINSNQSINEASKALFKIWINSHEYLQNIFSMTQNDLNSPDNYMKLITAINFKLSIQKNTLYSSQFLFNKKYFILFSNIADLYVKYIFNLYDCFNGRHVDDIDNNKDLFLKAINEYIKYKNKITKKITIYFK